MHGVILLNAKYYLARSSAGVELGGRRDRLKRVCQFGDFGEAEKLLRDEAIDPNANYDDGLLPFNISLAMMIRKKTGTLEADKASQLSSFPGCMSMNLSSRSMSPP